MMADKLEDEVQRGMDVEMEKYSNMLMMLKEEQMVKFELEMVLKVPIENENQPMKKAMAVGMDLILMILLKGVHLPKLLGHFHLIFHCSYRILRI